MVLLNQEIDRISDLVEAKLKTAFVEDFGVNLKRFDLAEIWIDEESKAYAQLRKLTAGQQEKTIEMQTDINLKNMAEMQEINANNLDESLAIQRAQANRFAELQTQSQFLGAHQINVQADVLKTAASNLGEMGSMNLGSASGGGGGGGGFNPVGMMTGLAVGGAMGGQMANMMNATGQQMPMPGGAPPPIPQINFNVLVDGQNTGPFGMSQLQQMVAQGQLTKQTYVWRAGMANWDLAGNIPELNSFFAGATPPPPPPPT